MPKFPIDDQYATGLSRQKIEHALIESGRRLGDLRPSDLGTLENFHTMGRIATVELADLAQITGSDCVLDSGSGIGGTSRFLAYHYGCDVTAVDLTEECCDTARWLNALVGLQGLIRVLRGDVTKLPFPDTTFDAVFSEHVQMNVADKDALYREARRVLVSGGRLALWDVTSGSQRPVHYPLPWADRPELSYLVSANQLWGFVNAAGLEVVHWSDLTDHAAMIMERFLDSPPAPLGLNTIVENFVEKATNLLHGLCDGRLRVVQGIARACN